MRQWGRWWGRNLFIIPAVLYLTVVLAYPIFSAFQLSMYRDDFARGIRAFVGLANYQRALTDTAFWHSLQVTLTFTVWTVGLELLLGLGLALLAVGSGVGTRVFQPIFLLPMFTPPIVAAVTWRWMLDAQFGVVNWIIGLVGIPPKAWLGDFQLALPSIMAIDVWQYTGSVFIIILAGLQSIPEDIREAAIVDGAGRWQMFWRITLPLIKPVILVVVTLRTMFALRAFDVIFATTQGGPSDVTQTVSVYIYKVGFGVFNLGYASALSILLLAVILLFSAAYGVLLRTRP